jgi:hypothetical protein
LSTLTINLCMIFKFNFRFAAYIGQWAIYKRTAYMYTPEYPMRMPKPADLQRTQAGRTIVWRG